MLYWTFLKNCNNKVNNVIHKILAKNIVVGTLQKFSPDVVKEKEKKEIGSLFIFLKYLEQNFLNNCSRLMLL